MLSASSPGAAGHGVLPSFSPIRTAALPLHRRGSLRNGNRAGDFLAAPRCGACTRAGATCRQPAMANGRCRFHGGLSTGPRTAEGRARCARARRTHGGYSREILELRRAARAHGRRVRALFALMRAPRARTIPAGHGVLSSNSVNRRDAEAQRVHRAAIFEPIPARAARDQSSSASRRLCGESPAGHGVLPTFSRIGAFLRRMLGLPRVAPARPHPYVPGAPPTLRR